MAGKKKVEKKSRFEAAPVIAVCVILLLTYISFSPSLKLDFTNWDDPAYVLENNLLRGQPLPLKEIFSTPVATNYHPLTILSLAFDYKNSALAATSYHRTNVILHLLNTLLVFLVVYRLCKKRWEPAAIVSLFFGIHPMHVESVTWVSERKDVLYVFFFLAALITWLKYSESNKLKFYFFTAVLFACSLLSKGMAVVFPVVLLLIDYLQGRKIDRKLFLEKIPFFVLSLVFGIVAFKIQSKEAVGSTEANTLVYHVLVAMHGLMMYIVKMLVPVNLCSYYPYPSLSVVTLPPVFFIAPFFILGFAALLYVAYKRKYKSVVFGLLFYIVNIALVSQLIPVGTTIMSDRYSYLSYVGLFFIVGQGYVFLAEQKKQMFAKWRSVVVAALVIVALIFSKLTYDRTLVWKNGIALFTDVVQKYPNDYYGWFSLGMAYYQSGDFNAALNPYSQSIRLNPKYAHAYNNRGDVKMTTGDLDGAVEDYSKAIALDASYAGAYSNRGLVKYRLKDSQGAMDDFNTAIRLEPRMVDAINNRGMLQQQLKNYQAAIDDYSQAIRINPYYQNANFNRGYLYYQLKEFKRAESDFSQAIAINPSDGEAYYYRGSARYMLQDVSNACSDLNKAAALGNKDAPHMIESYCR